MENARQRAFLPFHVAYPRGILTERIITFCGNMREDVNFRQTGGLSSVFFGSQKNCIFRRGVVFCSDRT